MSDTKSFFCARARGEEVKQERLRALDYGCFNTLFWKVAYESMVEADSEGVEFEWGKKRGRGGANKAVQFYESFTYDGVEYHLYDSVYMYEEDETEPYIGKLIKIWENSARGKKVKVLWFFRPCEIANFLGDQEVLENELFLASGEGAGLANTNPLEAIAGKCNVLCISKDSRNVQPSDEELQKADYIFRRTFDVKHCKIMDKMDDQIAGTDVKSIFNRTNLQDAGSLAIVVRSLQNLSKENPALRTNENCNDATVVLLDQNLYNENPVVRTNESCIGTTVDLLDQNLSKENQSVKTNENCNEASVVPSDQILCKENPAVKTNRNCIDTSENGVVAGSNIPLTKQKYSPREIRVSRPGIDSVDTAATNQRPENVSDHRASLQPKVESGNSKVKVGRLVRQVEIEEKAKCIKDSVDVDVRPYKKAKHDGSFKVSDDKNNILNLRLNSDGNDTKSLAPAASVADKYRLKSSETDTGPFKKLKPEDKTTMVSNRMLPNASATHSQCQDHKIDGQELGVTRRPNVDKSRWFTGPWEDRLQTAHEQGRLVLLQNLDPACTSAEVEDIVWQGFEESCKAKMIQRTAFSSPHSGQAFVLFKTRQVAEMVVKKLEEGCLLLSNGRPLLGRIRAPSLPEKNPKFFGHLVIDRLRYQMARENKDAVSTSHCSQPNTIEYDMAIDWRLLQERSDLTWKNLIEQQGFELKKLMARLKAKKT
ncbi:hypothetical protein FNV43_RR11639 [Rhamnella rubrinervis]|uniref:BAH domain-containing protein n=1 Tax=Rhamnella rubrinervis TaxID=2594499 RepID=A0A8K0H6P5_9ROSA|nr:hypothetical protein FNV43_RR11639 [Rhamnella rubrinervis]